MAKNILMFLLLLPLTTFAQSKYFLIDEHSRSVPDTISEYAEIAEFLTKNLIADKDKARAIYTWIAHNISYDVELFEKIKQGDYPNDPSETVQKTVDTKKGVCEDYAELFVEMGREVGLDCYIVTGYTRNTFGTISNNGHAWNSIKLGENYFLLDITWSAGHVSGDRFIPKFNDRFFLAPPAEFIKDHMPFDPIWQHSYHPITNAEFIKKDFSKFQKKGNFMFPDSIKMRKNLDRVSLLESEQKRMLKLGIPYQAKKVIERNLKDNARMIYNEGIAAYNDGVNDYNKYINYRNKRFRRPKIKDSTIRQLIDNASAKIKYGKEIFSSLSTMEYKDQKSLDEVNRMLQNLMPELNREKKFVDRYLKAWKPLRIFIF